MKLRFYGRLGELLGREVDVDLASDAKTVGDLRRLLADRNSAASEDLQNRTRACVTDVIVPDTHPLIGDETVEFFPPLSGG